MAKYKLPKKSWYKSKKGTGKCANCGKELPDNLLFGYVDETNAAITKNSPDYCWECYNKKYPHDKIGKLHVLKQAGCQIQKPLFPGDDIVIDSIIYKDWKDVNFDELIEKFL